MQVAASLDARAGSGRRDLREAVEFEIGLEQLQREIAVQVSRLTVQLLQQDLEEKAARDKRELPTRPTRIRRTPTEEQMRDLMRRHHNNQSAIARELGCTQPAVYHHLLKFGILRRRDDDSE